MFPLTLKGLTASLDGGSVDLTDSAGSVVGVIPPAVARSGPGNPARPGLAGVVAADLPAGDPERRPGAGDDAGQVVAGRAGPGVPGDRGPDASTLDPQATGPTRSRRTGPRRPPTTAASTFLPSGTMTTSGTTYDDIDFLDFSALGAQLSKQTTSRRRR